ncbi:MAG: ATP-binding protein [Acidimicrobiales bacterium]
MRPRSLRNRLALLFAVGATGVLVLAAALLYVSLDRQLAGAIDGGLRARADDLAGYARRTNGQLPDEDPFAVLVGADGAIVDSTGSAAASPFVPPRDVLTGLPSSGRFEDTDLRALGGPSRVLIRPVDIAGRDGALVVAAPVEATVLARERVAIVLIAAGPFVVAALAFAGWVLAGAALRPVGDMAAEADTISSLDELDRRLPQPPGDDEIAHLGRTLNAMLDRIEAAVLRKRAFLDDASHELRTPLTILRGELELALGSTDDPVEVERALRSAIDEADRLGRLAEDLLTLARSDAHELALQLEDVDLRALVERTIAALPPGGPTVQVAVAEPVVVRADADRLAQVLANLVANACRFARQEVLVEVAIERASDDGPSRGRVAVADDGPGFPPALLPVAFERFRRADRARSRDAGGTGLGLAIVAGIVSAHGGSVRADNGAPLGGAVVTVWLPRPSEAPTQVADRSGPGQVGAPGQR